MDQSDPETAELSKAAQHPGDTPDARLVRFASRLMLLVNLLLAGYFCLFVVFGIKMYRKIFANMGVQLPAFTRDVFSIPATAYWAAVGGLAAALLLLEFLARTQRVKLICNAVALVLLVTAILIVDASLHLPGVSITWSVRKM